MERSKERWAIVAILVAFVLLGMASSVINPLHEATDELRHYRFVRHIVVRGSLPVQGQLGCSAQGHHPPLYYAIAAAATFWIDTGRDICDAPETNPFWGYRYWEVGIDNKNQYLHGSEEAFPWHGEALAAHIARGINVLIGAGVVWITWLIGRAVWPEQPAVRLGGVAFVAFNPMFVYMAGSINNDVIAALFGSAITLACVGLLRDENGLSRRWGLTLGLLYGLALMSKFNLAAIALLIEASVSCVAWRRRQWRLWWQVNLVIGLLALLIAGWWFVRNQVLYGEPTGFQRVTELWGARDPAESWGVAVFELPYAWTSLWGRFGYGQIPLPQGIYNALQWVSAVALIGLALPVVAKSHRGAWKLAGPPLLFLMLNVVLFFAVLFGYLLVSPAGPMGRFFFPALPSLATLISFGLCQWADLIRPTDQGQTRSSSLSLAVSITACAAMAFLTLYALLQVLAPAYARPGSFNENSSLPNPVAISFDTLVKLRGYEISTDRVLPDGFIDIDLYWEVTAQPPGNYLLFIHLIDEVDTMVAQRDTHPGLGNFPSKQWRPGDRFVESIRLPVPETAYSPAEATLSVGLYAPAAYRLAISDAQGNSLGDALTLGHVTIQARSADYPNLQDQNFNNEIRLIGYSYSQRLLRPGENLVITLFWEALVQPERDYIVRVRLLDEDGGVRALADSRPRAGQLPTLQWSPGQIIQDEHALTLGPDLPAGTYVAHIALADAITGEAQNIVAEDGHWIDNRLLLSGVRIQP